jgi:L-ascorbate metabolism protein UlaG (beta-lactamase superfamily)
MAEHKRQRPVYGDMTVTYRDVSLDWLGYATLRIESPAGVVYVDPGRYGVLDGTWEPDTPGVDHPPAQDYDARDGDLVLITHDHHYDPDGVRRVASEDATVVAYERVDARNIDRPVDAVEDLPYETVRVGEEDDRLFGDVVVRTVPAYNEADGPNLDEDGEPYHPEGFGVGYLVTLNDVTVFWPGDSDALEGHEALDVDVFAPSIAQNYTMDRHAAADLAADMAPDLVLPIHYNSFTSLEGDSEAFVLDVANRGVGVALDEQ